MKIDLPQFKRVEEYNEKGPGIYMLMNKGNLLYIGQTTDLALRMKAHSRYFYFDRVEFMPVELELLDETEKSFIQTLNPPFNKQHRTAGKLLEPFPYRVHCIGEILQDLEGSVCFSHEDNRKISEVADILLKRGVNPFGVEKQKEPVTG